MIADVFHGAHVKRVHHLKRAASAHRAMMEGVATHAEKERVRREKYATARRAAQAISGPFRTPGQPV